MTAPNTSASGGYLEPFSTPPLFDDAFEDFLHGVVVGITGLEPQKVRPRLQVANAGVMPRIPEPDISWCALGLQTSQALGQRTVKIHDGTGLGSDTSISFERTTALFSFYGLTPWAIAGQFADGLRVPQNREELTLAGVGLQRIGDRRNVGAIGPNNVAMRRVDLEIGFDRAIVRTYRVLNLLRATGSVQYRAGATPRDASTTFDTEASR